MVFEISDYESMQVALTRLCRFLTENQASEGGVFNSRLVVTELIGNVLKHSKGTATLHGNVQEDIIELSVYASEPFVPPANSRCSEVFSENGRGLFLVDSVCERRVFTGDGAIRIFLKK